MLHINLCYAKLLISFQNILSSWPAIEDKMCVNSTGQNHTV